MGSIRRETTVRVPAESAWAALRDVAHPDQLFAGVLTDASLVGNARTVTFANGMIARERILDVDDATRRVAYCVVGMFEHHSASMQIVPEGEGRCRFIWIADLLPDEQMQMVAPLMEQGTKALVKNLEAGRLSAARGG
jgi:carbon monoxide dehydrogenase subunit G